MRRQLASALALASVAVGAVVAAPAAQAAPADCVVSDKLVNSCRPWLGASAGGYPSLGTTLRPQIEAHEQRIGRPVDIVHSYHPPGNLPFTTDELYFIKRPDTYGFINWKPAARWADAAGGNPTVDRQIDVLATRFASLAPRKIFLTLHHEPENDVSAGNCTTNAAGAAAGSPTDYRNMWRNVRQRFDARGVSNVVWVMDYMNYPRWDCLVPLLYPGDDLVDWVMFNAYGGASTPNFVANTQRFYDLLTNTSGAGHDYLSKPWGIVEWNMRNATSAQGAAYYQQAATALTNGTFPRLKAFMVFDNVGPDGNENRVAYTAGGVLDQAKQEAYTAFANNPLLGGDALGDDVVAPTAATALQASVSNSNPVTLTWGPSTDAGGSGLAAYRVYRDGTQVGAVLPGRRVFRDTLVRAGTSYTYRIQAVDGRGNASLPVSVAARTARATEAVPPSAPPGLRAVSATTSSVTLAWTRSTDNAGVRGYNVYRDGRYVGYSFTTTFTDTGLAAGAAHSYRVYAFDHSANFSSRSGIITARTAA
jgi:chitodextrinase